MQGRVHSARGRGVSPLQAPALLIPPRQRRKGSRPWKRQAAGRPRLRRSRSRRRHLTYTAAEARRRADGWTPCLRFFGGHGPERRAQDSLSRSAVDPSSNASGSMQWIKIHHLSFKPRGGMSWQRQAVISPHAGSGSGPPATPEARAPRSPPGPPAASSRPPAHRCARRMTTA